MNMPVFQTKFIVFDLFCSFSAKNFLFFRGVLLGIQVKKFSLFETLNFPQSLVPQSLSLICFGDSLDWKEISANEITQRVTSKVQPGSIVLFHNAALHTPEALPSIIEALIQDGYSFIPISQIILCGEYTIDHTGRQCPT